MPDKKQKTRTRIVIFILIIVLSVGGFVAYSANKSGSLCSGDDKLGKDGQCTVNTEGGCTYDPKLGPKSALC